MSAFAATRMIAASQLSAHELSDRFESNLPVSNAL
jgi:hypothetical protein